MFGLLLLTLVSSQTWTRPLYPFGGVGGSADPIDPTKRDWPPKTLVPPYSKLMSMRDGTQLRVMAWSAEAFHVNESKSTLLIRTPYDQATAAMDELCVDIVKAYPGLMVVTQDLRGTHYSKGKDTVFGDEWQDGFDSIMNLANQPGHETDGWWWNGRVVSWGASALAINQYCYAGENIESLRAQMLLFGSSEHYDHMLFQGGAFRENMVMAWSKGQGSQQYVIDDILPHPKRDDFYLKRSLDLGDRFSQVHAAGWHSGGFDCPFAEGTLYGFVGYSTRGSPEIRNYQLLQIGGIGHGAPVGEIAWPHQADFPIGDNQDFIIQAELLEKFGPRGSAGYEAAWAKRTKVQYFVYGDPSDSKACRWELGNNWPPATKDVNWYLSAGADIHHGVLSLSPPSSASSVSFVYDPSNPCRTNGGNNLLANNYVDGSPIGQGSTDQRGLGSSKAPAVSNRSDVLSFTSSALSTPFEFAGMVTATLFVQSDQKDTDFVVKLVDVFPDGREMLVSDGILRACRYKGFNTTNWLDQSTTYQLSIQVGSKAWRFSVGHKIMILVTSSNWPRFQRNVNLPNEMIPITVQKGNYAVATNTIVMSPASSSSITFPAPNSPVLD